MGYSLTSRVPSGNTRSQREAGGDLNGPAVILTGTVREGQPPGFWGD